MSIRQFTIALLVVLTYLLLRASPLQAQTPPIQLWYITFGDQADLQRLASELDVWEVDHATHSLLAPLSADEAALLSQTHTLTLAPDQSPLEAVPAAASQVNGIPGFECYRTVDETFATYDQLALDYPNLVEQVDIGDSWDKVNADGPVGDDMRVLVITNKATSGPKVRFLLMGAIHAREYTTAELALRFAEELLQGYGSDADATWLLDHGELHLLTIANPDGRRIAETQQLWRKNTHFDASCTVSLPFRSYGIDLNRNSSFKWNGCDGFNCSTALSCNETYRGAAPASEPEVAAIEAYIRTIFPDQRGEMLEDSAPLTTPGLFISLHAYGRLVLFPWGWTTTHAPNSYGLATLARRIGYPFNYTVCQAGGAGCLYMTDGTTDDFSYGELGVASYTIELGTAFFQSCNYFANSILPPGLSALRYAFTAAPLPYQLAEGPEVLNLSVSPQEIGQGVGGPGSVTISATADATRIAFLSGSDVEPITEPIDRVGGARLTIDELPWTEAPFTHAFSPTDGLFNTVQEAITTTLDMACLPSGRHTLYVQAQDDVGDWGVVAAEFVTVTNNSPFTATLTANQGSVRPGEPITYNVRITNSSAITAAYAIETDSDAEVAVTPSLPITLAAGASLQFTVVITPQKFTASTIMPTAIIVRSLSDPSQCRQVHVATLVQAWNYSQRLLIIGKD